jgi:membrane protease YdiL (CAAX protease family)
MIALLSHLTWKEHAMSDRSPRIPIEPQMDIGRSIVLHLVPGALVTALALLIVSPVTRLGYPPLMALYLAILGVLIPFEYGYLLYQGWRQAGTLTFTSVVLYRQLMPAWQVALWSVLLIGWSLACFMLLAPVDAFLAERLFSWMPSWLLPVGRAPQAAAYAPSAMWTTHAVGLALNGIAGPLVEELYFRGYLLPRLSRFGTVGSTVINVLLFSLYHFFSPWQNVTRIVALLPMVYLVARKRSIYLSIFAHCGLNTLGVIAAMVGVG